MAFSTQRLEKIFYSPYNVDDNIIHASATRVSLEEFERNIQSRKDDNVCIDDIHAQTGERKLEFVPHLQHYSTPRSRNDLLCTLKGVYGHTIGKRKSAALKRLLRKSKVGGAGIISPALIAKAHTFETFEDARVALSEKISSQQYPNGICVQTSELYIPPQALNGTRAKLNEIIDALRADCGQPPVSRARLLTTAHKYGSPKENISRGKFSMPRQVNTKKRIAISGRGVLSIFPIIDSRANVDTVAIPYMMFESFFGAEPTHDTMAIIMCYPINTLAHTPTYHVVPWEHDTIGVPSNFLAPQARDFDGDCAIVVPILDYESMYHARVLGSPATNIFSGVDFVVKPAPHIVLASGMTKKQLFSTMFDKYVEASITCNLNEYRDWYTKLETSVGETLTNLPSVSLASYMFGNETTQLLSKSGATRFDMQQLTNMGQISDGSVIQEGLRDGILYSNLFKVFAAGRRAVVESKCNIGDEGKKQNIIQFALPDTTVEWTFEVWARGRSISSCFIDILPVIYKVDQDYSSILLDAFAQYLAQ